MLPPNESERGQSCPSVDAYTSSAWQELPATPAEKFSTPDPVVELDIQDLSNRESTNFLLFLVKMLALASSPRKARNLCFSVWKSRTSSSTTGSKFAKPENLGLERFPPVHAHLSILTLHGRPSQNSIACDRLRLDNHRVTISHRIVTNKISLERSPHDLNADIFCLEFGQEKRYLQPYEVPKLFNFGLLNEVSDCPHVG